MAVLACGLFLLGIMCQPAVAQDDEYILAVSQDNYKVVFISGNLTAAATYVWPRVVFYHSSSILSPHFEAGFPRFYLFNDTDQDDQFDRGEAVYYGYLDWDHVLWNVTESELGEAPALGQYARFGMRATLGLHSSPENHTPLIEDWAKVAFWFRVVERDETFLNSLGEYVVKGKLEMRMNFTFEVLREVNATGLVMEQYLKGGGTTEMFLLREQVAEGEENMTMVSAHLDETPEGLNVTHVFRETLRPRQEAWFAKEDWATQAFYFWNSECRETLLDNSSVFKRIRSTYHTTGAGLTMHSVYDLGNDTVRISSDASIGIDESGFGVKVTDWFKKNFWSVLGAIGLLVAIIALTGLIAVSVRRLRGGERKPGEGGEVKPKP